MEYIGYILKILAFVIYIGIVAFLAREKTTNVLTKRYCLQGKRIVAAKYIKRSSISYVNIFILAVLFGLYSVVVSVKPYASDRGYYALVYGNESLRYQLPEGFATMSDALYAISTNPDFLFFFVSFAMTLIVLCLYRIYEHSNQAGLLLLFCSLYFVYGFHLLKQGIAIAVGSVALLYGIKKRYVISVLLIMLAASFHESALILLPVLMLLNETKKTWQRAVIYVGSIIMVLFFGVIASRMSSSLASMSSSMESEIGGYFTGLSISAEGLISAVKGLPVYVIAFVVIKYRKKLHLYIEDYDKYMVLVLVMAVTNLLSAYMYWMYRFGLFCAFYVFMFFGKILKVMPKKRVKRQFGLLVYGSTFFFTIRYLIQMFFNFGGF